MMRNVLMLVYACLWMNNSIVWINFMVRFGTQLVRSDLHEFFCRHTFGKLRVLF